MNREIVFEDLGLMDYKKAWEYQEQLFQHRVNQKLLNRSLSPDKKVFPDNRLLFVEHPHVYTLGKSGDLNNLLIQGDLLERIQATYYHIDRGGDITYHGPGQIVGYPIFDLENFGLHIKQYVYGLEESVILALSELGIQGDRLPGATGVWIEPNTVRARKICAIGVKASRHITMHGFAFNINTNLSYFNHINPCGFIDKGVTSVEKELGKFQDFTAIKLLVKEKLITYFLFQTGKNGIK